MAFPFPSCDDSVLTAVAVAGATGAGLCRNMFVRKDGCEGTGDAGATGCGTTGRCGVSGAVPGIDPGTDEGTGKGAGAVGKEEGALGTFGALAAVGKVCVAAGNEEGKPPKPPKPVFVPLAGAVLLFIVLFINGSDALAFVPFMNAGGANGEGEDGVGPAAEDVGKPGDVGKDEGKGEKPVQPPTRVASEGAGVEGAGVEGMLFFSFSFSFSLFSCCVRML